MAALLKGHLTSRSELKSHMEAFASSDTLLARIKQSRGFDLYILDILMPELSGIETEHRLRSLGRPWRDFLSNHF